MTFQATPQTVFFAHINRVLAEAATPVFVSTREGAERREQQRRIEWAEEYTGGDDEIHWCFICSRPTDHRGEHSDEQLLAFYSGKGAKFRR